MRSTKQRQPQFDPMVVGPSTIILRPYLFVRVYTCVDALTSSPNQIFRREIIFSILLIFL
jgi:hypothetical protein